MEREEPHLSPLRRLSSAVRWSWYAISLSWGGIAVLLHQTPHQFRGLSTLGTIVFLANLVLYVFITGAFIFEAIRPSGHPKPSGAWSVRRRVLHLQQPTELYFLPIALLAFAAIVFGVSYYGTPHCGPWLGRTLHVVFWVYTGVSLALCGLLAWILPHTHTQPEAHYPIVQILPFFPPMLSGTMAGILAPNQPSARALPMLVGGTTMQGLGILMFFVVLTQTAHSLTRSGLPAPHFRPEMFIAVGPPCFTILAWCGMAQAAVETLPPHFLSQASHVPTAEVLYVLAVAAGVSLWALALVLCALAGASLAEALVRGTIRYELNWWCMVFPLTGFVLATCTLGQALEAPAVLWVGSAMTIAQVALWLVICGCQVVVWVRRGWSS
ncbi:tellurite-resistance/dicarboxylate transporter family protein [Aspergillus saccharolyticus JOP 1030-1]|uniref:C4-dicarboxylate transporter/malic acid transport protein n=1 Tax=Aspergillus saccharolyticus JOP 1030-1 TaxID=1450539 RepID=A0A318YYT0_9EURO|nr:C4-dicarboxylate transporter/malic acid transport protein [Aspergillus saccharolyticus JOP 1030-1]PYH40161.1 C4-dicarboxylate transporter/malic acid transport protein [Aspergillus saccharolyticus JOP 1030-1]